MIDELRERFLPRFRTIARRRLDAIRAALAERARAPVAAELHALAGEASVIGLDAIAGMARRAEAIIRTETDGSFAECAATLEPIEKALGES